MDIEYPAIFHKEEIGYFVEFPDFGYVTEGDTLEEAKLMAGDLLNLCLGEYKEHPKPSTIEEVKNSKNFKIGEEDFVLMIKPKLYINDYVRSLNEKNKK